MPKPTRPEPAEPARPRRPEAASLPDYPASRLDESRVIATKAGWPAACPDPACRHGRCAGRLRSVGGGPATFPTCLAIISRWHIDPPSLTIREADAFLGFLRPGEGWTMQPTPSDGERGWPIPNDDGRADPQDYVLMLMPVFLGTAADFGPAFSPPASP